MLEALLAEGLLQLAEADATLADRHDYKPMPSPLSPAPMDRARTWVDADSLMVELTGSDLDHAYLEVVVPIFRTGHLFLDRDGRHVGEANTFPAAARTEVPMDWRGCPYPGNRYQAEKPMNMTALKAMRAHWRQMMALLLPIRAAYLRRFPAAAQGWTIAHVERLTVSVLALPSYMMLRRDAPVANGNLHPALSNLFRVTDGLRMVMHQMMFVPAYEAMQAHDTPITAHAILAYADRNYSFHSDHGVCAGPRFMVEDFLGVLLDGVPPRSGFDEALEPELAAAAELIEPAMDYGLMGLQVHGAVFALWPAMARTYQALHELLSSEAGHRVVAAAAMAKRFAGHFDALSHRSYLASEEWRRHREIIYDDMFGTCARGLGGEQPDVPLSRILSAAGGTGSSSARAVLAEAVVEHFGKDSSALAGGFTGIVMDFLMRGQQIVALAEQIQARIGDALHRSAPGHRLTLQQIDLHNALMGADVRSVPFLPDELGRLLGVAIHVDAETIQILRETTPASRHSPSLVAADSRA